jgi:hypothetical protein
MITTSIQASFDTPFAFRSGMPASHFPTRCEPAPLLAGNVEIKSAVVGAV